MRSRIFEFFEAVPLILFVILYRAIEPSAPEDWVVPYMVGAVVAIVTMISLRLARMPFNSLFLGINIYLLSGLFGIVLRPNWLVELYGQLQASGMLAWVVIVGFATLFFNPSGFIGIRSSNRRVVVSHSVYLLLAAIAAFLLAYWFRGNRDFGETGPFVILFLAYFVLRAHANAVIGRTSDETR